MRVFSNTTISLRIALVCCVHGNERYGLEVFSYFHDHLPEYPGLKIILAHEKALSANVRFIETDLNRSFPGKVDGSLEEQLATEILREIADIPLILDVHTTTSDIALVPFVTALIPATQRAIRFINSQEVILVPPPLGAHSLIGNSIAGVSLEYGNAFASRPETLRETLHLVETLLSSNILPPQERTVFTITGNIPNTVSLPPDATNFSFIPEANSYAILLHEAAYVGLHALAAQEKLVTLL